MHDEDVQESGEARPGLSRRRVLQGAVVAGGAVWAAPVVESFVTAAAAASAAALPFTYTFDVYAVGPSNVELSVSVTNTSPATEAVTFNAHATFGSPSTSVRLPLTGSDLLSGNGSSEIQSYDLTGASSGELVTVTLTITAVQTYVTGQPKSHVKVIKTVTLP